MGGASPGRTHAALSCKEKEPKMQTRDTKKTRQPQDKQRHTHKKKKREQCRAERTPQNSRPHLPGQGPAQGREILSDFCHGSTRPKPRQGPSQGALGSWRGTQHSGGKQNRTPQDSRQHLPGQGGATGKEALSVFCHTRQHASLTYPGSGDPEWVAESTTLPRNWQSAYPNRPTQPTQPDHPGPRAEPRL